MITTIKQRVAVIPGWIIDLAESEDGLLQNKDKKLRKLNLQCKDYDGDYIQGESVISDPVWTYLLDTPVTSPEGEEGTIRDFLTFKDEFRREEPEIL